MAELETKIGWNLSVLFKSDDDPEIEIYRKEVKEKVDSFVEKWKEDKSYMESPGALKNALDEFSALKIVGPSGGDGAGTKDMFYFWLRTQIDQNDPELKAKYGKSVEFMNELSNRLRFFVLSIGKIKKELQKDFLENEFLKDYKHFLERVFEEARYDLKVEEENILNLKSMPAYEQWVNMTAGLLSKEEREVENENGKSKKNLSEILSLLSSRSKKERDSAAVAFNEILAKFAEVAEAEMNAIMGNKKIDDKLRNAERPDTLRHISDDIDSDIVDAMVESVSSRFDLSKRFYELKAKLLGLEKLEYHERNVPYGKAEKEYTYEEAVKLVNEVFSDLDSEFAEIFLRLCKNGQVDVFPKKGKRQGAFCTDSLLYQPTYVMLNHTNELKEVLTLAHEMGHAINSEMMKKKCNTLSSGVVLSTAEVASTFMEDFVTEKLLENADEEMKLSLMMEKLNDDVSTIVRQVACYQFEQEMHKNFREKGYLSKEEIGKLFGKHMEGYMGDFVEQSEGSENWWVYWSHIREFFYVYSYASGLLISKAMQSKVKENKDFIGKVKDFLSSGMTKSPKDVFSEMGIDITKKEFWSQGLREVETRLNETEELARKLGKI